VELFLNAVLEKRGRKKFLHGVIEVTLSHRLRNKNFVNCHELTAAFADNVLPVVLSPFFSDGGICG
jgi:hypothetical protein